MCNTSKFQQQRQFSKVSEEIGLPVTNSIQLSPRKFEVTYSSDSYPFHGRIMVYHFYFADSGVKRKCIYQHNADFDRKSSEFLKYFNK